MVPGKIYLKHDRVKGITENIENYIRKIEGGTGNVSK